MRRPLLGGAFFCAWLCVRLRLQVPRQQQDEQDQQDQSNDPSAPVHGRLHLAWQIQLPIPECTWRAKRMLGGAGEHRCGSGY